MREPEASPVGSETVGAGKEPYLPLSAYERAIFDLRDSVSLLSESVGDIEKAIGFDHEDNLTPVLRRLDELAALVRDQADTISAMGSRIEAIDSLVMQLGRLVPQLSATLSRHRHDTDGTAIIPLQP